MKLLPLTTIAEYRRVFDLEHEVWGYTSSEDAVPVPMIIVTQKVGGLLLGAFDDEEQLVGFVYSIPGIRDGRPFHWSHMLGVTGAHRNRGVGWLLKLEQRREVIARGMDLVEWTFDPLQALNAHLNFVKLGAIAREYHLDVYGDSSSPLHRGTATDRLIVEWWLRSPRVEERLAEAGMKAAESAATSKTERRHAPVEAVAVNEVTPSGDWIAPVRADLSLGAHCLAVTIPTGFTEMQQRDLSLARDWRAATREIFTTYLPRGYEEIFTTYLPPGYEVADFVLQREDRRGTYILQRR
jgi:predicted GNAT superfamily acetyltransferase